MLECLAKRLHETQTGTQLAGQASPLMQRDPHWQQKIEKIGRIMRLAHNLPQHALFSQLEAVLRQMLAVNDMLLIRLDNQRLERLYPTRLTYDDDVIRALCHSTNSIERSETGLYWYSLPLRQQQQYFAHLLINTTQPLETDDRLFLDFLRHQLTLLLELKRVRQQLDELNSEESINQRLQQLRHELRFPQLQQHIASALPDVQCRRREVRLPYERAQSRSPLPVRRRKTSSRLPGRRNALPGSPTCSAISRARGPAPYT